MHVTEDPALAAAPRRFAAAVLSIVLLLGAAGSAAAVQARWTDTINGPANTWDSGSSIAVGRRSVYVSGYSAVSGPYADIWLRRYDRQHVEQWTDLVDGPANGFDGGRAVALTPDGGVVAAGVVETGALGYYDAWVRRYGEDMSVIWTDVVGTPDADETAQGVAVAPDGTIVVAGMTSGNGGDIWVRAYRPGGGVKWTRTANGPAGGADGAAAVAVGRDGSIFVCGSVEKATGEDIWVRKYTRRGKVAWTRTVNGPAGGADSASGIAVRPNGSVVVVGSVEVAGEGQNVWVRAYSARGARLWTRTLDGGSSGDDEARDVAAGADGSVYVAGSISVDFQGDDAWVRRYSPRGRAIWTQTYDGADHGDDAARGIAVAGDGSVYVTGVTYDAVQDRNIWVRKYR